jgi:hypothetical protein
MDEGDFIQKLLKEFPTSLFVAMIFILWNKLNNMKDSIGKIYDAVARIEAKLGGRRQGDGD